MGEVWLIHSQLVRFENSVNRCMSEPTFLHRFYEKFLESSPEVAAKFEGVNLERQATMLGASIRLVLNAAKGLEDGRAHLEEIAKRHSSRGLGIGAHLYALWLDALVETASEADPEWEDDLADVWRAALQPCIDHMTRYA